MKFRFATTNDRGFRKSKPEVTYCAFDTSELAAWMLQNYEHDDNGVELWFKGVSDALLIKESDVGSPTFQEILNFLSEEFPDIKTLKLSPSLIVENYTGGAVMDCFIDPEELNTDR